ncbi:MAG: type II secretion system F family protein [Dehalococcoidia bacterium]|nr:type II secretion system F family protein [Dehalococcoidia bacterium]
MAYKYIAYTAAGDVKEGVVEGNTVEAAEEALWRSNMTIAELRRVKPGVTEIRVKRRGSSDMTVVELHRIRPAITLEELLPSLYAVRKKDVIVFSRQLATLLSSGIAILPALRLLMEESSKKVFAKVLGQVGEDIQQGTSLSQAFATHSSVFPPVFVRLIEVGEQTGNLESILRRLADYLEKEENMVRKIRGAMTYPSMIIALAFVVSLIFVNFVIPGMTGLFAEFKAELPLPTRILLGGSNLVRDNFTQIIASLVLLGSGGFWYSHTPEGRKRIDYAMMTKIPFIKAVVTKGNMARLASILAMLLSAGLPLTEIMELLVRTTQNRALLEALERVRTVVLGGMSMSEALGNQPIFPSMLGQMVKVGEETGALSDNLETLAHFYEEETDRAVTTMTSMIEPALIIAVGGFIAFLAISIISPMYSILQVVK